MHLSEPALIQLLGSVWWNAVIVGNVCVSCAGVQASGIMMIKVILGVAVSCHLSWVDVPFLVFFLFPSLNLKKV